MSTLEQRIAAVLREHRRGDYTLDRFRDRYVWSCLGCTKLFPDDDALEAHTSALIAALFTEHTETMAVFADDDPPAFHDDLVGPPRPKRHIEWHPHTRHTTSWHGDDCPDCQAEPGIHDRRRAEMLAATLGETRTHTGELDNEPCVCPQPSKPDNVANHCVHHGEGGK